MQQDTSVYDSIDSRPLPKWLTDQRDGLNTYQPAEIVMKEDNSLTVSFIATGTGLFLIVVLLTIVFIRKNKKRNNL